MAGDVFLLPDQASEVDVTQQPGVPRETAQKESDLARYTAKGCSANISTKALTGEIMWSDQDVVASEICWLHLYVHPRRFVVAHVLMLGNESEQESVCSDTFSWMSVFDDLSTDRVFARLLCKYRPHFQVLFSSTNQLHFSVYRKSTGRISSNATEVLLTNHIPVTMLSATSGYLTSPGYDGLHYRPNDVDIAHTLTAPTEHVAVMVSFEHLDITEYPCRHIGAHLTVSVISDNGTEMQTMRLCKQRSALVLHARKIRLSQTYNLFTDKPEDLGFKMFFSFHKQNEIPQQNEAGQFNCSVSYYSSFQQHLHCNMYEECVDGRDEGGHCWFNSQACQGKFASGSKCFFPVFDNDGVSTRVDRVDQCQEKGGELAIIQTR
jgi:hypothetical protein